ncbi:MAG: hypothetical protein AABX00_03415 [Nanoarchaeota archaeon]
MKGKLEGIGGWLILFQISLWYSVLNVGWSLFSGVIAAPLSDSRGGYLLVFFAFLCVTAISLLFFYKKKRFFVKWMLISSWAALLILLWVRWPIPTYLLGGTFASAAVLIVMSAYLLRSNRVKNTFIN